MREGRDSVGNGGRGRGRGRGGRKKGKHFMDAVTDAYIRDMALDKWREVDDLVEAAGLSLKEAVAEAGQFASKGPYQEFWAAWWRREVQAAGAPASGELMGRIEASVRGALGEEISRRAAEGQPAIEDTPHYTAFVGRAMDTLLADSEGEIEDFDEDEL